MTQEAKQLLLKDLCSRLPYKPIVTFVDKKGNVSDRIDTLDGFGYSDRNFPYFSTESGFVLGIDEIRPYLRPMSSMTEEEKKEWHYLYLPLPHKNEASETERRIDWLNAHHFDYRGLIEKGLVLEAPEGMYKTK